MTLGKVRHLNLNLTFHRPNSQGSVASFFHRKIGVFSCPGFINDKNQHLFDTVRMATQL